MQVYATSSSLLAHRSTRASERVNACVHPSMREDASCATLVLVPGGPGFDT